ncbi:hypothetical protein ASG29_15155 [Sphingomonas sp. Leaf412]|uniref:hypothetical protein n=1 Tax=Sphingomonas sp. Leaf412 TaxID=1736370 RepID=UPI0006F8DDD8|nr:hypothetical protein [Sphingomonas sp. Leaf412]KQT31298.1 hypothetical protein ASG29_15155 [Sphingomonas sp. Leaf412]
MRQLLVLIAPVALAACDRQAPVVANNATAVESAVAPDANMAAPMTATDGNVTDNGVTDHGVTDHGVTDHGVTDH